MDFGNKQFAISLIVFIIILAAIAQQIIYARQKKEKETPKPDHNQPAPIKEKEDELFNKKNKILFLLLGALVLVGLIAYFVSRSYLDSGSEYDDNFYAMPIWFAVFLPFLTAKKKKENKKKKEESFKKEDARRFILLALIFGIFVALLFTILIK